MTDGAGRGQGSGKGSGKAPAKAKAKAKVRAKVEAEVETEVEAAAVRSDSVVRRVPQTFECRPTPAEFLEFGLPDELMIDWGGVPEGATASIYLPEVSADQMVATASALYGGQRVTRMDDHTVLVDATALTYLPIPSKPNAHFAGLLTLELPPGMKAGHRCKVTVRQISYADGAPLERDAALAVRRTTGRRVIGVFQFNIRIQSASELLKSEERSLGFFRWVLAGMEPHNRWLPVMQRFVGEIALRVDGFGGNSGLIHASPLGLLPGRSSDGGWPPGKGHDAWCHRHPEWPWGPDGCSPWPGEAGDDGKIVRLIFDRFGDYEGFCLETLSGAHRTYFSRERDLADLVKWVWQARIRVTVLSRESDPRVAERIVLHEPPASLSEDGH
jgi:hypothetical protein